MGVSLSTVNRALMAYDHGGIEALKPKPNRARIHQNMTLAEEKALLARFARAAGAGEMLNIHDLKAHNANPAESILGITPPSRPLRMRNVAIDCSLYD
jgi:hypothetical protein